MTGTQSSWYANPGPWQLSRCRAPGRCSLRNQQGSNRPRQHSHSGLAGTGRLCCRTFEPSAWVVQNLAICDVGSLELACHEADGKWVCLDHPHLQSLDVTLCDNVVLKVGSLAGLRSLQLDCQALTCGASWTSLQAMLQHLSSLHFLTLWARVDNSDVEPLHMSSLQHLTCLRTLSVSRFRVMSDLHPLQHLTGLTRVRLCNCHGITDLQPLHHLTGLKSLDLSGCRDISDLQSLPHLTGLKTLILSRCDGITNVRPLQYLTGLETLDLGECRGLLDLKPLQCLTGLQTLYLRRFAGPAELLEPLTSLKWVRIVCIGT